MPDEDGYPDDETFDQLKAWPQDDFEGLMAFLQSEWIYPDYIHRSDDGSWRVSTGGWSGHEDLISALRDNIMWWMFYWRASRSGGHYIFAPVRWDATVNFIVEPD
jgi:hypothetical protein